MRATTLITAAALAIAAGRAGAQDAIEPARARRPELRPFIGAPLPTGALSHEVRGGLQIGLQAALELRPALHVVGTLGWTMTETKRPVPVPDVDVLQYDLGVELGRVDDIAFGFQLHRYVGVGAGARTYRYRADALDNRTCAEGYAAVGAELGLAESGLRLEVRDNVSCYRAPTPNAGRARVTNDVVLVGAFAYHFE